MASNEELLARLRSLQQQAPPSVQSQPIFNPRPGSYAEMRNGQYIDTWNNKPANYGPNGEPGYSAPSGSRNVAYKMPDGRTAYYQPGNFDYDDPRRNDMRRANDLSEVEYGGQFGQLQRNLETTRRRTDADINTQRQFGDIYDKRLQDIYGLLQGQLNSGNQRIEGLYSKGQADVQGAYNAAGQAIQDAGAQGQSAMERVAQLIGGEEALTDPTQKLQQLMMQGVQQNAQAGAGAVGNLATLGTEMRALGERDVQNSQREGAGQRAGLVQQVMRAIAQAQLQGRESEFDTLGQLSDLQRERGAFTRSTLDDLGERRFAKEVDMDERTFQRGVQTRDEARQTRLDSLAEQLQLQAAALQKAEFERTGKAMDFEQGIAREQLKLQQRELEASLNSGGDPVQRALDEAKLRKIEAEIQKIEGSSGGPQTQKYGKGQLGMEAFMSTAQPYWGSDGAGPRFREFMADITNKAMTQAMDVANITKGEQDPYMRSILLIDALAKQANIRPDVARIAAGIFFGKA